MKPLWQRIAATPFEATKLLQHTLFLHQYLSSYICTSYSCLMIIPVLLLIYIHFYIGYKFTFLLLYFVILALWQTFILVHSHFLHTCIMAYLYTCIIAYLNTCILAYLHTCMLAYLQTCMYKYTCALSHFYQNHQL